ncbi:uncharacterized protein TM35_000432050 [Trypanosoma theileri]|uniref:Uncharacterized protein n=1 Tax=Trypanosoma theileri TaxID=67003 RepID=A0A1X0NJ24_9TRYP|nr:uncharacterized protein TM35_000432050 [Trypanosoma theileri]ORC84637.1 hypothetical protein TM35_000432050 [Trypanosoma theileri]
MFEVGGFLKNQILFYFLFLIHAFLGMPFPLVTFGHRKVEPRSIIPYSFEGSHGPANSLLESLRVHKLQTSYSTGVSRVVLGQNFIQEDPGVRISVPSAAVSFTYFTLV